MDGKLIDRIRVLFGQRLDGEVLARARTAAAASELFPAIGNRDPTPYDDAAFVLRDDIEAAVAGDR
jgi:hypothetical protein